MASSRPPPPTGKATDAHDRRQARNLRLDDGKAALMERLLALVRPFRPLARMLRSTRRTAAAVPDLVDAILLLPTISRHLEIVAFQTATLVEMHDELARVSSNTAALPHLDMQLARVHETLCHVELNTQAVQQLADMAEPLRGAAMRVGRFAGRLPQRHAAAPTRSNGG